MVTELCKIFDIHGSDKCPKIKHSYSPEYHKLLAHTRHEVKYVLEIGVGNMQKMEPIVGSDYKVGASLYAWREFFPNAQILALDIKREVLFTEDRIKCYYADQSDELSLKKAMSEIYLDFPDAQGNIDLILDDGSHIESHMILSLKTLFDHIKPNGIYIIEDIKKASLSKFTKLCQEYGTLLYAHEGIDDWDSFTATLKN